MIFQYFKKTTVIFLLVCMISVQMFTFTLVPKPAKAFWGIGDFTFNTKIADFYDIAKDIGMAAAERIALSYINRYLQRFVDKLLDKYKIRNYLYYTRVLDDYYIRNFIADKINDPDLKQMYQIAQDQLVSIRLNPTVDQRTAANQLLKLMKIKVDKLAKDQGVVGSSVIQNPPAGWTPQQKFEAASLSYIDDPSFLKDRQIVDFLDEQNDAEDAADQEIGNGEGLKSSRAPVTNGPSGLQVALTAIQNPGAMAQEFATQAVSKLFDGSYNSNSPWSVFGSTLGNFIFKKLTDTGSGNVLSEYPLTAVKDDGSLPPINERDIDGDGFPDEQDADNNGSYETCYHGRTAAGACEQSSQVGSSVYFRPICQALEQSITATTDFLSFLNLHRNLVNGDNFKNTSDAAIFAKRAMLTSNGIESLINAIENYHNSGFDQAEIDLGRYSTFISKVVESLIKDKDLDLARFGNGGGGIDNLIYNTANILDYLLRFQTDLKKCADPDINAAAATPGPDLNIPDEDSGGACSGDGLYGNDSGAPYTAPDINDVDFSMGAQGGSVASWSETGTLNFVSANDTVITLNYDKATTWPGVDIGGGAIAVSNPWIMVWRNGAWRATTFSWMRPAQYDKDIGDVFCGAYAGGVTLGNFMPVAGETYMFMVSCVARDMGFNNCQERTNIVPYTWPSGIQCRSCGGSGGAIGNGSYNNLSTVIAAKDYLVSQGVNLSGACGAFAIVQEVASRLNDGGGYLSKPSGNNCNGYATDIIAYPNGEHYDILGDGGGANNPQWNYAGLINSSRYVAA